MCNGGHGTWVRERICVMGKLQNQGVPQDVGIRKGTEWWVGMCGSWCNVSAIEAVQFLLVLRACLSLLRKVRHRLTSTAHKCILIIAQSYFCYGKIPSESKFKTTYRLPINHRHIYRFNYQANTTGREQKGLTLFPEGKQAWNPGGMNVNTAAHLPGMFCPSLWIKTWGLLLDVNYIQGPSHVQLHWATAKTFICSLCL